MLSLCFFKQLIEARTEIGFRVFSFGKKGSIMEGAFVKKLFHVILNEAKDLIFNDK